MLSFRNRQPDLVERMDEAEADHGTLLRTYLRFGTLNRMVAAWDRTYIHHIRPHLRPGVAHTMLDIGCGFGDISEYLVGLARADGFELSALGIDPSPFVAAAMAKRKPPQGVRYRQAVTSELVEEGARFDFVISNHLLHHLQDNEILALAEDCARLARIRTIHSDLRRSRLAYLLFTLFANPIGFGTYIHQDGRMSIRKSFRRSELTQVLPLEWSVQPQFPWRLLSIRHEQH
jgi:2-polyprenyl-3-methyl-5-hydroxy-6-metoxy-1,4-benzoquinol methylase